MQHLRLQVQGRAFARFDIGRAALPAMELVKVKDISIETIIGCRINGSTSVWTPKVKEVGGVHLMLISKWDRGFNRFLTGQNMDLRSKSSKTKSINCTPAGAYLDSLQAKKKAASEEAVRKAYHTFNEDGNEPKTKKRKISLTAEMAVFAPLVEIELPAVKSPVEMPPRKVKVAFGAEADLWLEVGESILLQMAAGMNEFTGASGRSKKIKKGENAKADGVVEEPRESEG